MKLLPLFIIPIWTMSVLLIPSLKKIFEGLNKLENNVYAQLTQAPSNLWVKAVTMTSLITTLAYGTYLWKTYPLGSESMALYPASFRLGNINVFELTNNLNLPFIILSSLVLLVALLTTWYSAVNMTLFCFMLVVLELCLVGAFSTTNLFIFLLFFELSALPIFILIAYCGSARRERLKAGYYFLFYTFYGSLSLLLVLINFYSLSAIDFSIDVPQQFESTSLWLLLFVAFAVKIPLFPFHIWLPYAHVEASTPTSIILAALMLKLGGFGLIRFLLPMFTHETHQSLSSVGFALCVLGCVYSSWAALRQIDLKRYVALSSVAHMSFATAGIFTFTELGIKGAIYLMLSHGFTSSAMFFLVGVLSDRYHTRAVTSFSGLLATMPLFSFFFIAISLANAGFPGTSGFIPEVEVLFSLLNGAATPIFSPVVILFVLFGMFLTTVTTLVPMLRMLFGHVKTSSFKSSWIDLTKLEFFVLTALLFMILLFGLYDVLFVI